MNNVRVYMRAGWSKSESTYSVDSHSEESSDVTVLKYEDADYYVGNDGWLFINRDDEEFAIFPPGEWAGVEQF